MVASATTHRSDPCPPTIPPLTDVQHTAISLLCTGSSLTHVAAELKISRMTLFRWRHAHPGFIAELARRQHDLRDTASRRLRLTLLKALATVTENIETADEQADRVKTALALLRHLDLRALLTAGVDDQPTDPDRALNHLIRADVNSAELNPLYRVESADRESYLAELRKQLQSDAADDPTPTHKRLRRGLPYPTLENAPPPPPEFEI